MKKTVTLEQIYTELLAFRKEQSVVNAKQASFNKAITRRVEEGFARQATFNEAIVKRLEAGFIKQAILNKEITRKVDEGFARQTSFNKDITQRVETGFAKQFGHFDRHAMYLQDQLGGHATKDDVHRTLSILDQHTKRLDDQEVETVALVSQTRRHEHWLQRLAKVAAKYLNTT